MKVNWATQEDITEIESHAETCFKDMGLDKLGLTYCGQSNTNNLTRYVNNENYIVLKCFKDNSILGVLTAYIATEIFNDNKSVINVFMIQAKPSLKKTTKGRVVHALIKKIEDICKKAKVNTLQIGAMPCNKMGSYFAKNDYTQGDIIYYKEVI